MTGPAADQEELKITRILEPSVPQLLRVSAVILAFTAWQPGSVQGSPPPSSNTADSNETNSILSVSRGNELAHIWCSGCHVFPEPDLLDKKTWKEQTLPRMKIRLGLSPESLEMSRERDLIK